MFRDNMWKLGKVVGGSVAVTGGLLVGSYPLWPENYQRSAKFWVQAAPKWAHYSLVQWYTQDWGPELKDAAFNRLHEKYAPSAHKLTLEMRGFFLKNAQIMSQRDDFVPEAYLRWCKLMQNEVPTPFRPGAARTLLEESLGKPLEEIFSEFDEDPSFAASIGQVHRARLKDGTRVAVKVQYPGMEEIFRGDIATMITFCELAMKEHVEPLKEIEKQFMTEFDYRLEAQNLETVRKNLLPKFGKRVVVPKPFLELCTKDILVMEWLDGVKLIDGIRKQYSTYAEKMGTTLEALEKEQKKKIEEGRLQRRSLGADKFRTQVMSTLLRFTDLMRNLSVFAWNCTIGIVPFVPRFNYEWSVLPINLGEVLALLIDVHGYEVLINGVFNGDPHPGNILLLEDGRIGLVDFGQVKTFQKKDRLSYAKLIIALQEDNKKEIVRLITEEMGYKTKYMNPEIIYNLTVFWNDRDDILGNTSLPVWLEQQQALDPLVSTAAEHIMASRVSVMMRGLALPFGLKVEISPLWQKYAKQALKEAEKDQQTYDASHVRTAAEEEDALSVQIKTEQELLAARTPSI